MNGAESLVRTLIASDVNLCFANPGTSEMHFVAALDKFEGMRCILGLAETVVTGCADGYARMAGKPAATLLHLGPGLANGAANLHNARRARSPVVNVVGDHARGHLALDAPLTTDLEGVARPFSKWVKTIGEPADAGHDTAAAITAATSLGGPATLIVPADVAWSEGAQPLTPPPAATPVQPGQEIIETAARLLRSHGQRAMLLLGGRALGEQGVEAAARLAAATGARLTSETFNTRAARGAGRAFIPKVPYMAEAAEAFLKDV